MTRAIRLAMKLFTAALFLVGLGLALFMFMGSHPERQFLPSRRAEGASSGAAARRTSGRSGAAPSHLTQEAPRTRPGRPSAQPSGQAQPQLEGWQAVVRSRETGQEEARIKGERASLNRRTGFYDIYAPIMDVLLSNGQSHGLDVKMNKARVTARRAEWDEKNRIVRLYDGVNARGEDFEVNTDSVIYRADARTLESDAHVRIERTRPGPDGKRVPALLVTGEGLSGDLFLNKLAILKDVETHLYNVSRDFLATGVESKPQNGQQLDIVITCKNNLTYEHIAHRITFSGSVKAVAGSKTLACETLTLLFAETEGSGRLEVTQITAEGNVQLKSQQQDARGQKLVWNSVTQTGVLTGNASVEQPSKFKIAGEELTFYRMNNRFHAEGPGSLSWHGNGTAGVPASPAPAGVIDLGSMRLTTGGPLNVTWNSSMTYDAAGHTAQFAGQVVARQKENVLRCEKLELDFDPGTGEISNFRAVGSVAVQGPAAQGSPRALCNIMIWNPKQGTTELVAAEGESVDITTAGNRRISSSHIVLDNDTGTLECPAAGSVELMEQQPGGPDKPTPAVSIRWQEMMRYEQAPKASAMFTGAVVADRAGQHIRAETLRVEFADDQSPKRITATGNAVIDVTAPREAAPDDEAPETSEKTKAVPPGASGLQLGGDRFRLTCETAVVDLSAEVLSTDTPGELAVFQKDERTGLVKWQKGMRFKLAEGVAEFQGAVAADMSGAMLKSEQLRLDFDEARKLRHARAQGNVSFMTKTEGAWQLAAGTAEAVFAGSNQLRQVIARDGVRVTDQSRTLTSESLQLFFKTAPAQGGPTLERAIADSNVRVTYRGELDIDAGGDRLEWNAETDTYALSGDPCAYMRQGNVKTENSEILLDRQSGRLTLPPGARPVRVVLEPTER